MDLPNTIPANSDDPDLSEEFEPFKVLNELKRKSTEAKPLELPLQLPLDRIKRAPELFQPRGLTEDERHTQELTRAVNNSGLLDPILVMQIGPDAYLIDGHHRVIAYGLAGVTEPVPVSYFQGSAEEAVLERGRANTRAKLPMSSRERQDFAWRLVLLGRYSKSDTVEAAGVSHGQVGIMRRAKKALGADSHEFTSWLQAQRKARGRNDFEMSDEDRDAWKQAVAAWYADSITKTCGPRFWNHPEIAAMALERCFGRRLEDLVSELLTYMSDDFREQLRLQDEF